MGETIGKIVVEIGKALGKAVIAGVGLELARVASGHVKKRFGPKEDDKKKDEALTPEEQLAKVKAENDALKAELERLKNPSDGAVTPD